MLARQVLLNQPQSLVPFLLLALLAHALVIWAIKITKPVPTQNPLTFEVQLMPIKQANIEQANIEQAKVVNKSPATQTIQTVSPQTQRYPNAMIPKTHIKPIMPLKESLTPALINAPALPAIKTDLLTPKVTEQSLTPPTEPNAKRNKLTIDDLLNSARRIAQEDALAMPKEKSDGMTLADREFSPQLAKAMNKMKKLPAGTYPIGNGMMKIIGIDGSAYCLAPPPNSAMPVSALNAQVSMPMTCPNE